MLAAAAGAKQRIKLLSAVPLLPRMRANLRHASSAPDDSVLHFGLLTVDPNLRTLSRDGTTVHLTPTEYEFLRVLALHTRTRVDPPATLKRTGLDSAGKVVEIAPNAPNVTVGDRVWGAMPLMVERRVGQGSAADFVTISTTRLAASANVSAPLRPQRSPALARSTLLPYKTKPK